MISHKYKCIFIHIPKAAGQSIERIFLDAEGLSWEERAPLLLRPNHDPKLGPPFLAHLTIEEYKQLGYISEVQLKTYYKFAFVRNPWARMVSEYAYRKKQWKFLFCTFEDFLTSRFPTPKDDDYGRTPDDIYRHILPQADFIYNADEKCLVDFVGRVENLHEDFAKVAETLNLGEFSLPHINKSKHLEYKAYYTSKSQKIVAELYKRDIAFFDYGF